MRGTPPCVRTRFEPHPDRGRPEDRQDDPSGLLEHLERSGLTPTEALLFTDADLEAHLYPPVPPPPERDLVEPDVAHLVAELACPGVTRKLLWEEYRKVPPAGLGYTAFCDRVQNHRGEADLVMRQEHKPGEKIFVDDSVDRFEVIDPISGEVFAKELFVMAGAPAT